jgi:hypothetical protein
MKCSACGCKGPGPPGWESLKSETVVFGHESAGLGPENYCSGEGQV